MNDEGHCCGLCALWEPHDPEDASSPWANVGYCHLEPARVETHDQHWCSRFKDKDKRK